MADPLENYRERDVVSPAALSLCRTTNSTCMTMNSQRSFAFLSQTSNSRYIFGSMPVSKLFITSWEIKLSCTSITLLLSKSQHIHHQWFALSITKISHNYKVIIIYYSEFALYRQSANIPMAPPTQIYTIAKVAREKLLVEARAESHNLRRLVGHANLYDVLLIAYKQHQEVTGDGPLVLSWDGDGGVWLRYNTGLITPKDFWNGKNEESQDGRKLWESDQHVYDFLIDIVIRFHIFVDGPWKGVRLG